MKDDAFVPPSSLIGVETDCQLRDPYFAHLGRSPSGAVDYSSEDEAALWVLKYCALPPRNTIGQVVERLLDIYCPTYTLPADLEIPGEGEIL